MKTNGDPMVIAAMAATLLLGGCATSRSIIDIPKAPSTPSALANGKQVKIQTVVDQRVFETSPSDPSTPSLDPKEDGGDKIRARAIARKRNGYGRGLGDMLLPDGKSVKAMIEDAVEQSLTENGYKVVSRNEQAGPGAQIVDVQIGKLWSWMNPGFVAITLNSEIETGVEINDGGTIRKELISVKASEPFAAATEGNWVIVMRRALKAYVDELKVKIK